MAVRSKSQARLDFRLSSALKVRIEQAAILTGQSVSDFAIATLAKEAQRVIQENTCMVLSDRDRDRFLAILDGPAKPNKALSEAAKRYRRIYGNKF